MNLELENNTPTNLQSKQSETEETKPNEVKTETVKKATRKVNLSNNPKRKPNKAMKKKKGATQPKKEVETLSLKDQLKNKLKEKLKEKQLERTSKIVREKRMEKIEDILDGESEETVRGSERRKLKEELKLLEKIEEKQDTFTGDFPEYSERASFGGSQDRSE
jgi:hypothetical protein